MCTLSLPLLIAALAAPVQGAERHCGPEGAMRAVTLNVAQTSPAPHSAYDTAVVSTFRNHIQLNHARYMEALAKGHPHAVALVDLLGFRLGPGPEDIHVPTPSEIVARYNAFMDDLVARGVIQERDRLRPARVFKVTVSTGPGRTQTNYVFVPHGEAPPAGAVPYGGALRADTFHDMIAQGYFPLSEPSTSIRGGAMTGLTLFIHDLAHFTAFMQHPEYMAELRRSSAALDMPTVRYGLHLEESGLFLRSLFINEYLPHFSRPAEARPGATFLALPRNVFGAQDLLTVDAVEEYLLRQPEAVTHSAARRLLRLVREQVTGLGGASRDIITEGSEASEAASDPVGLTGPLRLFHRLEALINNRRADPDELRETLARAAVAFHEYGRVPMNVLVRDSIREHVDPTSAMYRIACLTGLYAVGTRPHTIFCTRDTHR